MREVNNNLFETLSKAALIICKGDLNYRKLVGDFCWDFNEPLVTCIRGFAPSHILCLRVITSEALCGLSQDLVEGLYKKNKEWMSSGEYATVQYVEKNYCGCKKEEEDEEEVQIEPTSIVSLGEAGASSAKQ